MEILTSSEEEILAAFLERSLQTSLGVQLHLG